MPDLHRKKLCLTFCDEHYNATVQVVTLQPGVTFTSWVRSLWNLWALKAQEGQRSELLPLADGQSESALAQLALELGRTARLAAWRWGVSNGWNGWNGRIFHRKTWQMRDRTGLRQYAAWMNCCSIFFRWKRRWWSMPAPYGDWSSWCWSCPYFDCTLGVLMVS